MNSNPLNYVIIDHTADLGMVVKGADARDLFANAAYAMIDLMIEGDMAGKDDKRQITIEGEDYSDLMVRWLGEILYLFAAERRLAWDIEITAIVPNRLQSSLSLISLEEGRHEIKREIKAVTYHQIAVEETPHGWETRVIFDI